MPIQNARSDRLPDDASDVPDQMHGLRGYQADRLWIDRMKVEDPGSGSGRIESSDD